VDKLSRKHRSWNMSRIRGSDTQPEQAARALLRSMGFRPQVNRRDLPGVPDLVIPSRNLVIFVHGCFWHRHSKCKYAYTPKSNVAFWKAKFRANRAHDDVVRKQLTRLGWRTFIVWECELRELSDLRLRIRKAVQERRRVRPTLQKCAQPLPT